MDSNSPTKLTNNREELQKFLNKRSGVDIKQALISKTIKERYDHESDENFLG